MKHSTLSFQLAVAVTEHIDNGGSTTDPEMHALWREAKGLPEDSETNDKTVELWVLDTYRANEGDEWTAQPDHAINGGFVIYRGATRVADVLREKDARLIVLAPLLFEKLAQFVRYTNSTTDSGLRLLNSEAASLIRQAEDGS